MNLRLILVSIALLAVSATIAAASDYNYISAGELETRLESAQPTHIIDIQEQDDYEKHHIKGATATYAYPVKSDSDKAKLAATLDGLKQDEAPVVIVCPRGAGGATRTYDYLLTQGLPADRLLILEKGQAGWSDPALTEGH